MKLFLVDTMVFVGSIWKSKSGWFLFVMSLMGLYQWPQKCCWPLRLVMGSNYCMISNPSFAENQPHMT
jgi:hypothetical protein